MSCSALPECPHAKALQIPTIVHKPEARLLFLIDHPSEEDSTDGAVFSGLTYRSAALWKLCIDAKITQAYCAIDTVLRCVVPNKAAVSGNTYMQCLHHHIDETLVSMPIQAIVAFGDIPAQHLLRNYTKTVDGMRNTDLQYQGRRLFVTYPLSTLTDSGCSACNANVKRTLMLKDVRAAYDYALKDINVSV